MLRHYDLHKYIFLCKRIYNSINKFCCPYKVCLFHLTYPVYFGNTAQNGHLLFVENYIRKVLTFVHTIDILESVKRYSFNPLYNPYILIIYTPLNEKRSRSGRFSRFRHANISAHLYIVRSKSKTFYFYQIFCLNFLLMKPIFCGPVYKSSQQKYHNDWGKNNQYSIS